MIRFLFLLFPVLLSINLGAKELLSVYKNGHGCFYRQGYVFCIKDGKYTESPALSGNVTHLHTDASITCVVQDGKPICWGEQIIKQPPVKEHYQFVKHENLSYDSKTNYCVEIPDKHQVKCFSLQGKLKLQFNEVYGVKKLQLAEGYAWIIDSNGLHGFSTHNLPSSIPVAKRIKPPPLSGAEDFVLFRQVFYNPFDICVSDVSRVFCWKHRKVDDEEVYELIPASRPIPDSGRSILKMNGIHNEGFACALFEDSSLSCRLRTHEGVTDYSIFQTGVKDFMLDTSSRKGCLIDQNDEVKCFRYHEESSEYVLKNLPRGEWLQWTSPKFIPPEFNFGDNSSVCIGWEEGTKCFALVGLIPRDYLKPLEPHIQGVIKFSRHSYKKANICQMTRGGRLICYGQRNFTVESEHFTNVRSMHIATEKMFFLDGDEVEMINRSTGFGRSGGIHHTAGSVPNAAFIGETDFDSSSTTFIYAPDGLRNTTCYWTGCSVTAPFQFTQKLVNPFQTDHNTLHERCLLDREGLKCKNNFHPFENPKHMDLDILECVSDNSGIHCRNTLENKFELVGTAPKYGAVFSVTSNQTFIAVKHGKIVEEGNGISRYFFPKYETRLNDFWDIAQMIRLASYEAPKKDQDYLVKVTDIGRQKPDIALISLALLPYFKMAYGEWDKRLGNFDIKVEKLLSKNGFNSIGDIPYNFERALNAVEATLGTTSGLGDLLTPKLQKLWEKLVPEIHKTLESTSPDQLSGKLESLDSKIQEFRNQMQTHFLLRSRIKTLEILIEYARGT